MSPFDNLSNALRPSAVILTLRAQIQPAGTGHENCLGLPLRLNHQVHPFLDFRDRERREPEAGAPTLDGGHDLVHVVADDAEPHVLRVLLDDATERCLCRGRHHVRLVEDDELVALGEERPRLGEVLDLLADDVDTTIVRRIQL